MNTNIIWGDVKKRLQTLPSINQQSIIKAIKKWYADILITSSPDEIKVLITISKKENFDYYWSLDESEYDFNPDWEDWVEYILNFKFNANPPDDIEGIVIRLRNLMHDLFVYKTKVACPNCDRDELRCYSYNQQIYFECDICLHLTNSNIEKVSPTGGRLIPATKSQLEHAGLLRK